MPVLINLVLTARVLRGILHTNATVWKLHFTENIAAKVSLHPDHGVIMTAAVFCLHLLQGV